MKLVSLRLPMKKTFWIVRAAALVTLAYAFGHMSGYPWAPGEGPSPAAVVQSMHAVAFDVEGAHRTYWDFYVGFAHLVSLSLVLSALALWQLAPLAIAHVGALRPLLITFLFGFVVNAALAFRF